ncbi:ArsR/SmtB family transcription factor [Bradyrhizobium oligotrophicum]|uniref:ArsR/SmtB family transcription factor n=1 Tax=Bradyrhizobium oligotrophicum TaxID=44255 RepID=UPI003EBD9218
MTITPPRRERSPSGPAHDGDLVKNGVCGLFIAEKLGVSAPTLGEHMRVLVAAGLVKARRVKGWIFYKRDQQGLKSARRLLNDAL